ncbi:hypothetical protein AN467_24715 [Pseudomonas aeruginosa]|uniref:hypothetical protein n=1 Tax=Pseudomonas aeruginosa TaxID=287 RepID=UPI00071B68F9|nr:hypothetical protein [Pseudomonas aeruginosa]ALY62886.1 hypothetical protein HW06_28240 [Pseudomonas aeruginosa]ALZ93572.1 hypothetical protein APT60_25315 [Pseudomonas aeruginosa]KSO00789.1 hypothetical protein APA96_16865 [Pseudomonas aeruginosa]MBG4187734.1 hypothetical protein [Pseudomonas aeruginosa]MBG4552031.1 hypothetical protein [Pseudomonas aeruginosa]
MAYRMRLTHWVGLADALLNRHVTYYFKPGRSDGFIFMTGTEGGLTNFHLHTFEKVDGDYMVFTGILPKSGSFREGDNIDLATERVADWLGICAGMNQSTLNAVQALGDIFVSFGSLEPE